jgi:predicted nuclease of restriction endonuclease-like (RecB) superfamily
MKNKPNNYNDLIVQIGDLVTIGRQKAGRAVNSILVQTYWQIGRHIVEFEQKGNSKSTYGSDLLNKLSADLRPVYGTGFSRSNLFQIRLLYLRFPIIQTLSGLLAWSHYIEIIKEDNELARSFYIRQCEHENWSVRELKRQMKSMLFYRLASSRDKESVLQLSRDGAQMKNPEDVIKDPYVFEFLGIPANRAFTENELEQKLIENLQQFLLELGKGFAFIGRQYKISISNRHFFVDLVFYHRILKCFVLFDLKSGEINHQDIGQMNLYLNYFSKEENSIGDNPPIGIVLGAYKDQILIEYALDNIGNQLFVSKYQLYMPDPQSLSDELSKFLDDGRDVL